MKIHLRGVSNQRRCYGGMSCCRQVAGLPEAGNELAVEAVLERYEWNPSRRDGTGQDGSGHRSLL